MAARFGDSDYREERILQAKPPEDELDLITKEVGDKWKSLLIQLGVPSGKIKSFLHDNNNVSSSACFDGLVYWREGNKPCKPATWSVLLEAIERGAELKVYAQEIRDKLFSKKDHVDSSMHEEVYELRKALKEKEEELKELRQKSQEQSSSASSPSSPSFLDQPSPYRDNSQGFHVAFLRSLERMELSPTPREQSARKYSEELLKSCQQIKVGPPAVYKLKKKLVKVVQHYKLAAFRVGTGSPDFGTDSMHKVLMIVGATGCGKSTIINALANYTLGVSFTDDYRYQLISPHEEGGRSQTFIQTSWVTAYTFPRQRGSRVPYTLTIVDTPGYGGTRGIDRDQDVTQQIKMFFNTKDIGVDHLNAVAFVVKSHEWQLTRAQKYIFTTILGIFGKDIQNCIMIVATHAEGRKIPAIDALKMAKVPLNQQLTFAVSNVALYAQNNQLGNYEDDWVEQHRTTWDRNAKSYQTMFYTLADMDDISLWQTTENLKERDNLRVILDSIGPRIQEGIAKENEISKNVALIRKAQRCLERIREISLNPNPAIEEEYIDMMIKAEEQNQELGWEDRVAALYTLKKNMQLLSTVKSLEDCSDEEVLKGLKQFAQLRLKTISMSD